VSHPSRCTERHVGAGSILCAVQWALRSALNDRGVTVDFTTVCRGVQCGAPELDQRCRPPRSATNDSSRVDETSITIHTRWYDRSCAVGATRATLDLWGSPPRDADAAERCFREALRASHPRIPQVITVDTHAASPPAFETLQQERTRPETCQLRPEPYRTHVVEQDHRCVKCRVNPGLGCGGLHSPADHPGR
jgi:transposase-like protein